MQDSKHANLGAKNTGINPAGENSPDEIKKNSVSPEQSKKSSPRFKLMSVVLDEGQHPHAPKNPKATIAFVGISVGSPDFEGEEFWEICRAIIDAEYKDIVFVVGGVLQRHNVYLKHAHKQAIKGIEVTDGMIKEYQSLKKQKKKEKSIQAENDWIEKHKQYFETLEHYGKTVTVIKWNDILENKFGNFSIHSEAIQTEYNRGNGIRTYVRDAADEMFTLRKKQTRDMKQAQKLTFRDTCSNLSNFFKEQNEEYFKEETAAFRLLITETYKDRKLDYIYPNKNHEIGENFLRAIRRALELLGKKDQIEFYSPVSTKMAKKGDVNQRLHEETEKLKSENKDLLMQRQELLERLESIQKEQYPHAEEISRLQQLLEIKQDRLGKVGLLVEELNTVRTQLQNVPQHLRAQLVESYIAQIAEVTAQEELDKQQYQEDEVHYEPAELIDKHDVQEEASGQRKAGLPIKVSGSSPTSRGGSRSGSSSSDEGVSGTSPEDLRPLSKKLGAAKSSTGLTGQTIQPTSKVSPAISIGIFSNNSKLPVSSVQKQVNTQYLKSVSK